MDDGTLKLVIQTWKIVQIPQHPGNFFSVNYFYYQPVSDATLGRLYRENGQIYKTDGRAFDRAVGYSLCLARPNTEVLQLCLPQTSKGK